MGKIHIITDIHCNLEKMKNTSKNALIITMYEIIINFAEMNKDENVRPYIIGSLNCIKDILEDEHEKR